MRKLASLPLLCASFASFAVACDDGVATLPTPEVATIVAPLKDPVVPSKELFVTALNVVDSTKYVPYKANKWDTEPDGGFSFGRLIDNMAPTAHQTDAARSAFVMNWLRTWESPQTINGQVLPPRPLVRDVIIEPWKQRSIGKLANTPQTCAPGAASDFTCKLSFLPNELPFELIAIVNRPDLRVEPSGPDMTTASAAQGRFIFVLVDADKNPLPFTVIFEYMVPTTGLEDMQQYAGEWHKLGKKNFDNPFNDALFNITKRFTKRGIAPWRNNGSALLQLRTNDVMLAEPGSDPSHPFGVMWELREFVIGGNGQLTPDTVKMEPRRELSGTPLLAQWLEENAAAIQSGKFEVPATYQGEPFLAASSIAPFGFVWDGGETTNEAVRDAFALNTCNGCHVNETGTGFLHAFQFTKGAEATLSPFLASELAGPRANDLTFVLEQDYHKIKTGKGKDKGHKPGDVAPPPGPPAPPGPTPPGP